MSRFAVRHLHIRDGLAFLGGSQRSGLSHFVNQGACLPTSSRCAFSGPFRVFVQVFEIQPLFFNAGGLFCAGLPICFERLKFVPRHGGGLRPVNTVAHAGWSHVQDATLRRHG